MKKLLTITTLLILAGVGIFTSGKTTQPRYSTSDSNGFCLAPSLGAFETKNALSLKFTSLLQKTVKNLHPQEALEIIFVAPQFKGQLYATKLAADYTLLNSYISGISVQNYSIAPTASTYMDHHISKALLANVKNKQLAATVIESCKPSQIPHIKNLNNVHIVLVDSAQTATELKKQYPELADRVIPLSSAVSKNFSTIFKNKSLLTPSDQSKASLLINTTMEFFKQVGLFAAYTRQSFSNYDAAHKTLSATFKSTRAQYLLQQIPAINSSNRKKIELFLYVMSRMMAKNSKKTVITAVLNPQDRIKIHAMLERLNIPAEIASRFVVISELPKNWETSKTTLNEILAASGLQNGFPRQIVFVSKTNTGLSPMASGYFKNMLKRYGIEHNFDVSSAGFEVKPGDSTSVHAAQIGRIMGFDIRHHRAKALNINEIESGAIIFAFDLEQRKLLREEGFDLLQLKVIPVADPAYKPLETYMSCFFKIKASIGKKFDIDDAITNSHIIKLDKFNLLETKTWTKILEQMNNSSYLTPLPIANNPVSKNNSPSFAHSRALFRQIIWNSTGSAQTKNLGKLFTKLFPHKTGEQKKLNYLIRKLAGMAQKSFNSKLTHMGFSATKHHDWQKSFAGTEYTLNMNLAPKNFAISLENNFSVKLTKTTLNVQNAKGQTQTIKYTTIPKWNLSSSEHNDIVLEVYSKNLPDEIRIPLPDESFCVIRHVLKTENNKNDFYFSDYGVNLFDLLVLLQHSSNSLQIVEDTKTVMEHYVHAGQTYERLIQRLHYINKFFSIRQFATFLKTQNPYLAAFVNAPLADLPQLIKTTKRLKNLKFSIARQNNGKTPEQQLLEASKILHKYKKYPRLIKILALESPAFIKNNKNWQHLNNKLQQHQNSVIERYLNSPSFTLLLKYITPHMHDFKKYIISLFDRDIPANFIPAGYGQRVIDFIKYIENNPQNVKNPSSLITIIEFILGGGAIMLPSAYDENSNEKQYQMEEILQSITKSAVKNTGENASLLLLSAQTAKHTKALLDLFKTCGFSNTHTLVKSRNWSYFLDMTSVNSTYIAEDTHINHAGSYSDKLLFSIPEILTDLFRAGGYTVDNFPTLEILRKNPEFTPVEGQALKKLKQRFQYFKSFNSRNYKALELLSSSKMNFADLRIFLEETRQLVLDYIVFISKNPVIDTQDQELEFYATPENTLVPEAAVLAKKFFKLEQQVLKQLDKKHLDLHSPPEHMRIPPSVASMLREFKLPTTASTIRSREFINTGSLNDVGSFHELINLLHQNIISKSMLVFSLVMEKNTVSSPLIASIVDSSYQAPVESTINVIDLRTDKQTPYSASSLPFFEALRQNAKISPNASGKSKNITLICDETDAWGYIQLGVHSIEIYVNNSAPDKGGCVRIKYSEGAQSIGHRQRAKLFTKVFSKLGMSATLLEDGINVEAILDKDTGAKDIHHIEKTATFIIRMVIESYNLDLNLVTSYGHLDKNRSKTPVPDVENTPKETEFINAWANQLLTNNYIFLSLVSPMEAHDIVPTWNQNEAYNDLYTQRMDIIAPEMLSRIKKHIKQLGLPDLSYNDKFGQILFNKIQANLQKALNNKTITRDDYGKYSGISQPMIVGPTGNRNFEMLIEGLKTEVTWADLRANAHWFNQIKSAAVKKDSGSLGGYNVKEVNFPLISSNNIVFLTLENRSNGQTDMAVAFEGDMCIPEKRISSDRVKKLLIQSGYIPKNTPPYYDTGMPPAHTATLLREPRHTSGVSPIYTDGIETSEGTASGQLIFVNPELTPEQAKGKILVAKYLMPEHDDLIRASAGVVTTHGGQLSHASIRAREFGKPCLILKTAQLINNRQAIEFPIELGTEISGTSIVGTTPVHFHTRRNIQRQKLELQNNTLVMLDAEKGKLYYIGDSPETIALLNLLKAKTLDIEKICQHLQTSADRMLPNFAITYILEIPGTTHYQIEQLIDSIMLKNPDANITNYISNYHAVKYNDAVQQSRKLSKKIKNCTTAANMLIPFTNLQHTLETVAILKHLLQKYTISADIDQNLDWLLEDTFFRIQARITELREQKKTEKLLSNYTQQYLATLTYKDLDQLNSDRHLLDNLLYNEQLAPLDQKSAELTKDYTKHLERSYANATVIWKDEMNYYFRPIVGGKASNSARFAAIEQADHLEGFAITKQTFSQVTPNGDWAKYPARKLAIVQAYWNLVKKQRLQILENVNALDDIEMKNKLLDALYANVFENTHMLPYDNLRPWVDSAVAYTRRHIQNLIATNYGKVPQALISELQSFGSVAVRSSGLKEDSQSESFAGQNLTLLNVKTAEQLLDAVQSVWKSGAEGVLVEQMLNAAVSGVAFSADAITGDSSKIQVNAAYGLGEGIVSGIVDTDKIVIDKASGELAADPVIGAKLEKIVFAYEGGTKVEKVSKDKSNKLCLDTNQQAQLCRVIRNIENDFGYPVDVEWAINGFGNIIILQVRPITTIKNKIQQARNFFETSANTLRNGTIYRLKLKQLHDWVTKLEQEHEAKHIKYLQTGISRKTNEMKSTRSLHLKVPASYILQTSFPEEITLEKQIALGQTLSGIHLIESTPEEMTLTPVLNPHKKSTYTINSINQAPEITLIMPLETIMLRSRLLPDSDEKNNTNVQAITQTLLNSA